MRIQLSLCIRNSESLIVVCVVGNRTRAAENRSEQVSDLSSKVMAELVAEICPLWHEQQRAAIASRPRLVGCRRRGQAQARVSLPPGARHASPHR